ncbi:emp24/gp25L/p24 family protein [Sulfuracidifex metallicus]|uniref:Uncharacterized protein n=1 Tax=Sulfuracidifex metallicus DSM 6482 = JCM 9184 TaxID=523847 RepID=A0A6A9QWZ5_SULME|nr:emp24/gp25L/p24 family protein [Sulfuracidifex metallicus]MUN29562.1 hypothetical protein [Sulfuracidifex metallicus DSM 6482 = JCM 9184]WOE49927.1 emp24/gp25L/p24 family protein [Sulfuracidifex metallicus DSM 6482 = JCM 9184]
MNNRRGLVGKLVGVIILILAIGAILFVVPIPHTVSYNISKEIPAGKEYDFSLDIPKGSTVYINLSVSGGVNTIFFNIVSPNGSVTRIGLVNSMSYQFTSYGGDYTFQINNGISLFTKNVTGTMVIHEDTPLLSYDTLAQKI